MNSRLMALSRYSKPMLRNRSAVDDKKVSRGAEDIHHAITDHGHALIWLAGLDQGRHYFNRPWLDFTGCSLEQELGGGWMERVHPDDRERCLVEYSSAFDKREKFSLVYRLRRHDGEYRWIVDGGNPRYAESGNFLGYVGHCLDITDIHTAEEALLRDRAALERRLQDQATELAIAKDAAKAAGRAKSTFLANISHELRTPMSAIMGMTHLALRRTSDPKQQDYLNKSLRSSERMLDVIDDILSMARIEAERVGLEQSEFTLSVVLQNLQGLLGAKAEDKGLHFDVHVSQELARLPLHGDALRLGHILLNLTGNAIKFTTEGSIDLRVSTVEESAADVVLRFDARDTGIGIPAEHQKRLFNAFEQVDSSTTRPFDGVGLGLAISKRLVELMGGAIGVNSYPGMGSTFWFTVRLAKRNVDLAKPPVSMAPRLPADAVAQQAHALSIPVQWGDAAIAALHALHASPPPPPLSAPQTLQPVTGDERAKDMAN